MNRDGGDRRTITNPRDLARHGLAELAAQIFREARRRTTNGFEDHCAI
jgi:hypothetical protein